MTENLYEAFKSYRINGQIDKCPCGCIPDEEERKIYSKPLNELTIDDLGFYLGKAMSTWGEVNHFKHFLPRLFELYSQDRYNGYIDLNSIVNKLEYGKWIEWRDYEKNSIIDYTTADWIDLVNFKSSQLSISTFEDYSKFIDFAILIELWDFKKGGLAFRNFVGMIEYEGYTIFNSRKPILIKNKDCTSVFQDLLLDNEVVTLLENEFFEFETSDYDYAGKISLALQMIENELKIRKNDW